MHDYDRSSKWLIQHHGDSILRLGGVRDIRSWHPLQAEIVQPRQLPDGLLEVLLTGQTNPSLFVIEIATYPELRILEQIARDMMLVYLDRRVLPEVLTLVLRPRGTFRLTGVQSLVSPLGWTRCPIQWRVIELWTLPAEDLLAGDDPGLLPWVPLTHFSGPREDLLQRCRERIEAETSAEERPNLLAVSQVLTRLRYNDPNLLTILGGSQAMIESPLIQEIVLKHGQEYVLRAARTRFGEISPKVEREVRGVQDEKKLAELLDYTIVGKNLPGFLRKLRA